MQTRRSFLRISAAAAAGAAVFTVHAEETALHTVERPAMGCLWTVKLHCPDKAKAARASEDVFAKLAELDGIMSDYKPESELMRLCAAAGTGRAVPVSDALFRVLQQSRMAAEESGGLFDVTIGPCTRLWRISRKTKHLPDKDVLAAARAAVDWRSMALDPAKRTVELKKPGMQLDLGGIAKGFALDECLTLLREKHGISAALIDAAGQVAASGPPPGRPKWTVVLKQIGPEEDQEPVLIDVSNASVDTSGDLHQYAEIDGARYSHIVDPRTGLGMTQRAQVTVVAPSAATADWLATVMCLMNEDAGAALLARHPGAESCSAFIRNEKTVESASAGFNALKHKKSE